MKQTKEGGHASELWMSDGTRFIRSLEDNRLIVFRPIRKGGKEMESFR